MNGNLRVFMQIDSDKYTVEEKGTAILEVLKMPTHNGITKDAMLRVIKFLLYLLRRSGAGRGRYARAGANSGAATWINALLAASIRTITFAIRIVAGATAKAIMKGEFSR